MTTEPANETTAPQFAIQRIYTKDISFETPTSPHVFQKEWKPEVSLDLQSKSEKLADDAFEVVLTLTVTTKLEGDVAFLAEIQQAGIFTLVDFPEQQQNEMLGSFCPNLLFPYGREMITDLVVRGGFPPLYLAPINFDALYAEHQTKMQAGHDSVGNHDTAH